MARLSPEKLAMLKRAFTEDAMTPGQAAQAAGVTYATAKRYYDRWGDEIKRAWKAGFAAPLGGISEAAG